MSILTIDQIRNQQKVIAEYRYELRPVVRGYSNRTLYIDLGSKCVFEKPVTQHMKDVFTGGRGFGLWLLWNGTKPETKWNDPENELVFTGGPIGGITAYPGTGKCTVVSISPQTNVVIDSNGGSYFGPYLKFAGWDALEIQGKANSDVVIVIDGDSGCVSIEEALYDAVDTYELIRALTEYYGNGNPKGMRGITIASAGQAANYVPMCGINLSYYDSRRDEVRIKQAARGGTGRVLRDKRIKAIVIRYSNMNADSNGVADMSLIRKAGQRINKEIVEFDPSQNDMRGTGTPYLVEIMNRFDLLPVENFRFGSDPEALKIAGDKWKQLFDHTGPDGCWVGCSMACAHGVPHYHLRTGPEAGKAVFVDGPEYETLGALGSNLRIFNPQDILELNYYCDTYGIDTISAGNSIAFAMECFEYGVLNLERTGGIDLAWGNAASAFELIHQMSRGEGFGTIVGHGVRYMKKYFVDNFDADVNLMQDIGMETKGLEISEYLTKESLTQQGGYAMASKGGQHDEAWLIFMELVHKQLPTFEAKAEALHYFPMWRTWFSLHGLCKLPWNDIIPVSNKTAHEPAKVPEHVENYTWLHEGVTGIKVGIEEIILQSERVYNFQRLFNLRLGYGTRDHDYPPYRAVGPVTKKEYESRMERYDKILEEETGANLDGMTTEEKMKALRNYRMNRYEKLIEAVYNRRGWSEKGIPTIETVTRLDIGIPEIIDLITANA